MNKSQTHARWRWRLARAVESTGRMGWLGLAALIVSLAVAATALRGLYRDTEALKRDIGEIRQGKVPADPNATVSLSRLLPNTAAAADFATLLNTLAAKESVRVERMEYQMQRESGKAIVFYRADLVAAAPYLKLRAWIDTVLRERPTVALDELVLERPNAETGDVIARIRLTLFMRGES